ncbi:MAG: hypothetical protein WBK40_04195 [Bacteroidales bacterium]|jgi:hypothetical protein
MILFQEIAKKKKQLIEKSSVLEKTLYALLSGQQLNISDRQTSNNIEKIGLGLLEGNRNKVVAIIQKEQKADSSFQYHYCQSLLELTIMTLADPKFEQVNIHSFLKTRGLKEAFVLSFATNTIDITSQKATSSKIDKLINQIFIKKDLSSFTKHFIDALQDADELLEIFVIEKCYENLIDFHPIPNVKKKIEFLLFAIEKYNDRIELKIKRQFFAWSLIILIILGSVIGYVIPAYWSQYDFDILTTIASYVFPILGFLLVLYFFLFHKIESKFSIVTSIILIRKRKINKKYGIDLEQIEEIKKNLNE